jgi:hypothetical protein
LLRYHIQHAQAGNLLEIKAHSPEKARDRIRLEGFGGDAQALVLNTDVEKRVFHVHQLRGENVDGDWRSIHIQNALVNKADLRVHTLGGFEAVEVSWHPRIGMPWERQWWQPAPENISFLWLPARNLLRPTKSAPASEHSVRAPSYLDYSVAGSYLTSRSAELESLNILNRGGSHAKEGIRTYRDGY